MAASSLLDPCRYLFYAMQFVFEPKRMQALLWLLMLGFFIKRNGFTFITEFIFRSWSPVIHLQRRSKGCQFCRAKKIWMTMTSNPTLNVPAFNQICLNIKKLPIAAFDSFCLFILIELYVGCSSNGSRALHITKFMLSWSHLLHLYISISVLSHSSYFINLKTWLWW